MSNRNLSTARLSMLVGTVAAMLGAPVTRTARTANVPRAQRRSTDIPVSAVTAGTANIPGAQRRWALDFHLRLDQPGGRRSVVIELSGDWVSTVTAVRPGEYEVALQIANARVTGEGSGHAPPEAVEQLRHRLARVFWATYRNDGSLIAVHFFKDTDPSDRNLLEMIATETQLVRPQPAKPVWTVLERDGAGSYLAIYNKPQSNVVVKRKLKYVHTDAVAGAPPDQVQVALEHSELHFALGPHGGVVALDGTERVRMGVPFGPAGQLSATTEIHLANLRRIRAPQLIGSLARALPDVMTSPVVTFAPDPEQERARNDASLLAGRTTESLLKAAIEKADDPMLPDRLAALFRQRPRAIAAALALLPKAGPQRPLIDALGSAGSPAAIAALGRLARDPAGTTALRVEAIGALIEMPRPSVEAMRLPRPLLDDPDPRVRAAAHLMSGTMANRGRAGHPAEATAIDRALVARYQKAQDVQEVCNLLAAFGNSVGPSVVPLIEQALRDPRAPVRAAAVRGLRLAPGPEVDRLLSAAITSDPDPGVRTDAIFAASFRRPLGPVIGQALVHAATTDGVVYVRSDAVTLLRRNPDASTDVAKTLAWVAEHDANPGIRRLARRALAPASQRR